VNHRPKRVDERLGVVEAAHSGRTDANAGYRPTGHLSADLLGLGSEIIARLRTSSFELQLRLAADARSRPELYTGFQQVGLQPVFNSVRETVLDGQRRGVCERAAPNGWPTLSSVDSSCGR
jgi:hypothetical protein